MPVGLPRWKKKHYYSRRYGEKTTLFNKNYVTISGLGARACGAAPDWLNVLTFLCRLTDDLRAVKVQWRLQVEIFLQKCTQDFAVLQIGAHLSRRDHTTAHQLDTSKNEHQAERPAFCVQIVLVLWGSALLFETDIENLAINGGF